MVGHLKTIPALGQSQQSESLGFYPRFGALISLYAQAHWEGRECGVTLQGYVLRVQQGGTLSDSPVTAESTVCSRL